VILINRKDSGTYNMVYGADFKSKNDVNLLKFKEWMTTNHPTIEVITGYVDLHGKLTLKY
jgi:hypothetical protein